jgi:hypothetical protein
MLVESNTPSVFTYNYDKKNTYITKGSVVNGRFKGKIEKFGYFEETFRKVDWESTRKYVKAGAGLGFRDVKTYSTGRFNRTPSEFLDYNDKGQIEGNYIKDIRGLQVELDIKDGIIKTYVVKDNKGVVVDSLSIQNKIWKINYKYVKNSGLVVFSGFNNIRGPREYGDDYNSSDVYNYDYIICYNEQDEIVLRDQEKFKGTLIKQTKINAIVPVGGDMSIDYEKGGRNTYVRRREMNSGGKPSILDNNGLYSIYNENLRNSYLKSLYLDLDEFNGNSTDSYVKNSDRDSNLFTIIYNYLVNDSNDYQYKKFNDASGNDAHGSLLTIVLIIEDESEKNIYRKYLNPQFNKKNTFF